MSLHENNSFVNTVEDHANGSAVTYKRNAIGTSAWNIITVALFTIIIIIGTAGSGLVIATIVRWKKFRTPCNYLLMNIAVADLCVALVSSPVMIIGRFASWPFGKFMCHVLGPFVDVFICVSVITHTAIAVERHRAIASPFKKKISIFKTKIVILVTWFACYLMVGLPISFHARLRQTRDRRLVCFIKVPRTFRHTYEIYLIVFFVALPLAIQTWAYFGVVRATTEKNELLHTPLRSNNAVSQREELMKARHRLVKIVIVLVIIFQICYIPRGVMMILREFGNVRGSVTLDYIDLISLVIYYLKHIVNPIVLFVMSSDFQTGFYHCLCCIKYNFFEKDKVKKSNPRQVLISSGQNKTSRV